MLLAWGLFLVERVPFLEEKRHCARWKDESPLSILLDVRGSSAPGPEVLRSLWELEEQEAQQWQRVVMVTIPLVPLDMELSQPAAASPPLLHPGASVPPRSHSFAPIPFPSLVFTFLRYLQPVITSSVALLHQKQAAASP